MAFKSLCTVNWIFAFGLKLEMKAAQDAAAAILKPQRPFVLHRTSRASFPILKYLGWIFLDGNIQGFYEDNLKWFSRVALDFSHHALFLGVLILL